MLFSTFLTLVLVPVVYTLLAPLHARGGARDGTGPRDGCRGRARTEAADGALAQERRDLRDLVLRRIPVGRFGGLFDL